MFLRVKISSTLLLLELKPHWPSSHASSTIYRDSFQGIYWHASFLETKFVFAYSLAFIFTYAAEKNALFIHSICFLPVADVLFRVVDLDLLKLF